MRASAALCLLLLAGCEQLGITATTDDPSTFELRVASASLRPGALMELVIPDGRGVPGPTDATLGDLTTQLVPSNDSTMVGLVPNVAAGQYELRLPVADLVGVATLTVLPAPDIPAPATHAAELLDAYAAEFPDTPPAGITLVEWDHRRATLDSIIADAKTRITSLSFDEQLAIAQLLDSFDLTALGSFSIASSECVAASADALTNTILASVSGGALLVFLSAHGTGLLQAAGIAASAAALYGSMTAANASWIAVSTNCEQQDGIEIAEYAPAIASSSVVLADAQPLQVQNGVPTAVHPLGTFRPLTRSDALEQPDLAEALSWLDKLVTTFQLFPAFVQELIGVAPSGPPATATSTEVRSVDASTLTVTSSAPGVTFTAEPSGDALILTATTTSAAEIPFSFTIASADASSATVPAVVVPGPWTGVFTGTSVESGGTYTWSITMDILQVGNTISGTTTSVDVTGDAGSSTLSFSGVIEGGSVTFSGPASNGAPSALTLTLSGDVLSGTQVAQSESGTQNWDWNLTRQP